MAIKDNLISYWSLNEASGNALDAHGGNVLTETGGTIDAVSGIVGGARDFEEGDTEWFVHADNADLSLGNFDFTYTVWVQIESKGANKNILSKGLDGSTGVMAIAYRTTQDRFRFNIFGAAGFVNEQAVFADNLGIPALATWYFIVAWYDAAADTINIQVNNGTVNSTGSSTFGAHDEAGNFFIGAGFPFASAPGEFWDGLIDEVGFWKRVLTADERAWLYNSGSGRSYADFSPRLIRTYRPRPFAPGIAR